MKKNKYYTPEIEEFHVGFECEIASINNNWLITDWVKKVFNEKDLKSSFNEYIELYRVKYLNKEDIESLGFVFKKHWVKESDGDIYKQKGYGLTWFKKINSFSIWSDDYEEVTYFRGNIKNKSELKILLKQLGIL